MRAPGSGCARPHGRGRISLLLAGAATVAVAAFPVGSGTTPPAHTVAAASAFVALTAFPVLALRAHAPAPVLLRPAAGLLATAALTVALGWFTIELTAGGDRVGLSERVAAGAQALWPLAVAVSCRLATRRRPPS